MEKISIEELNKILNDSLVETLNKIEKDFMEKDPDSAISKNMFAFNLQNMFAMQEYKSTIEKNLGLK